MKTWASTVALGAAVLLSGSAANAAPSALAKACAKDIKSVCGDVKPGGGKAACMKDHFSDLSADCQIAYIKVAAVGRACKAEMKQFCADVKPGKGGKAECLKSHAAELSEGCKEAMAKAAAGGKQGSRSARRSSEMRPSSRPRKANADALTAAAIK